MTQIRIRLGPASFLFGSFFAKYAVLMGARAATFDQGDMLIVGPQHSACQAAHHVQHLIHTIQVEAQRAPVLLAHWLVKAPQGPGDWN